MGHEGVWGGRNGDDVCKDEGWCFGASWEVVFLCKVKDFGGVVELGSVAMGDCKEASIRI